MSQCRPAAHPAQGKRSQGNRPCHEGIAEAGFYQSVHSYPLLASLAPGPRPLFKLIDQLPQRFAIAGAESAALHQVGQQRS